MIRLTARPLALAAALLSYRTPPLIALNEPEASLHPDMLPPLAEMIARAAQSSQLWIVTHSERLAQEVAILAARSDVREELDRLDSHVSAARALLAEGQGVGRKLDFLGQEFVREANTLCSKSASTELTRIGLDLKAAIERLKEQAANVE